jgi:hypothetical protein
MKNKGFRQRKNITKNEVLRELRNKHNAGAVQCSEEETKSIAMEQENERNRQIWHYFLTLAVFKRQGCELDDIKATIDDLSRSSLGYKEIDGIFVSCKTMSAKLEEYFMAHRKMAVDAERQLKILKEAWKVKDDELEKKYKEWIVNAK